MTINPLGNAPSSNQANPVKSQKQGSSNTLSSTILKKQQEPQSDLTDHKVKHLENASTKNIAGFSVAVASLDDLAIRQGFGYKAANSMILESEVSKIKLKGAVVKVPPFVPINDATMQEYLNHAIPELQSLWKQFLDSFEPSDREKFLTNPSQSTLTIPPKGLDIIARIQEKIQTHFNENTFVNDKLTKWLEANPHAKLTVRSSGKEDTDESSNAGGNESVKTVNNDPESISKAIGTVISSYFGQKSISQRLAAGDTSLFTEPKPFLPVFIQVKIEEEPNNIPRSGVMFTSQHDRSSSVTLIQTGLGHNEGVVENKVGVDSYFVDSNHHIHSVVRKKETRMKDSVEIPNDPKLQTASALSQRMIGNMKTIADHLQTLYNKPLDVEYTIKQENLLDVVYILQDRPLNKPAKTGTANYIDFDKANKKTVAGNLVASAEAKVIHASSKENVIFAETITEALNKYNSSVTARENIQAVIINQPAASTSHQAVFLQARGLSIISIENSAEYVALEKENEWTIDIQQGIILVGDVPKEFIHSGYISYPIPRELTVDVPPIAKAQMIAAKETDPQKKERLDNFVKRELSKFNADVPMLIQTLSNGRPLPPIENIRSLLRQIALLDKSEAKLALATLIDYFSKNMASSLNSAQGAEKEALLAKWMVYESLIQIVKNELLPAIEKHPPQSLERLFPLKFVETLILQPASKTVVGGFSFGLTAQTGKKEKASLEAIKGTIADKVLTANHLVALNWKGEIYRKDYQDKWIQFVSRLSQGEVDQLVKDLIQMQKLGFLSDWINIRFPVSENPRDELSEELEKSRPLLEKLQKTIGLTNQYEKTVDEWSNPAHASKNSEEFMKNMVHSFSELQENYESAGWIGKMAILAVSSQMIDVYDKTIKAVTGSTEYVSNEQKLVAFRTLLGGYRRMLEIATGNRKGPGEFRTMNEFLNYMEQVKPKESENWPDANPFLARDEFKVEALLPGYKGRIRLYVRTPLTEEEFFSFSHQNLVADINDRKNTLGMNSNVLPSEMKTVILAFTENFDNLTSISKINGKLRVEFNIPLNIHSGKYNFVFDPKHPDSFQIEFHMYGLNVNQRFKTIGSMGALISNQNAIRKGDLPLKFDSNGVSFSLQLPVNSNLQDMSKKMTFLMNRLTDGGDVPEDILDSLSINLAEVDEKTFRTTLHVNHFLMKAAARLNRWDVVSQIAKQTILSLGRQHLGDYNLATTVFKDEFFTSYAPAIADLIGNYNLIPNNEEGMDSVDNLASQSALYLVRCLQEGGDAAVAARHTIAEFSSSQDVMNQPQLAEVVVGLQAASASISPQKS